MASQGPSELKELVKNGHRPPIMFFCLGTATLVTGCEFYQIMCVILQSPSPHLDVQEDGLFGSRLTVSLKDKSVTCYDCLNFLGVHRLAVYGLFIRDWSLNFKNCSLIKCRKDNQELSLQHCQGLDMRLGASRTVCHARINVTLVTGIVVLFLHLFHVMCFSTSAFITC